MFIVAAWVQVLVTILYFHVSPVTLPFCEPPARMTSPLAASSPTSAPNSGTGMLAPLGNHAPAVASYRLNSLLPKDSRGDREDA